MFLYFLYTLCKVYRRANTLTTILIEYKKFFTFICIFKTFTITIKDVTIPSVLFISLVSKSKYINGPVTEYFQHFQSNPAVRWYLIQL